MLDFREDKIVNVSDWKVQGSSKARLVQCTPNLDGSCAYIARVSSKNQGTTSIAGLLRYCAAHAHWSVFEQGAITVEVVTPLAIAIQLLRHRSFTFQQFSGRYQDQKELTLMTEGLPTCEHDLFYMPVQARMQDTKNRQNSIETDDELVTKKMQGTITTACLLVTRHTTNFSNKELRKKLHDLFCRKAPTLGYMSPDLLVLSSITSACAMTLALLSLSMSNSHKR